MKAFMRICGILALIMMGAGLALAITGYVIGGPEVIASGVETATGGRVSLDLNFRDGNVGFVAGDYSSDDLIEVVEDIFGTGATYYDDNDCEDYDFEGKSFEDGVITKVGDMERFCLDYGDIEKLKVELGGCDFRIEKSDDDGFWLEGKNVEKLQWKKNDEQLILKIADKEKFNGEEINVCKVRLYVPESYQFEKVEFEVGAGSVKVEELDALDMEIKIGAGKGTMERCCCDELKINVGVGEFEVEDMDVRKLDCEVGAGNIKLQGLIDEKAKVECAAGNIKLVLNQQKEDFDYDMEAAMGNIRIGDVNYAGVGKSMKVDNDADREIELQCAMGNITILFEEE